MANSNLDRFHALTAQVPIIAILRGVRPDEVIGIAQGIYDAGIRVIEVPLNSPDPLTSIKMLADHFGESAIIGAGTVLSIEDVAACYDAGGQIVVSPNMKSSVIGATISAGMISLPGCLTPTEAFAALDAGANGIKMFPGELVPPNAVKAVRAVLPGNAKLYVVGGVSAESMASYRNAGAHGFGIGGSIYKAGYSAVDAQTRAEKFVAAFT